MTKLSKKQKEVVKGRRRKIVLSPNISIRVVTKDGFMPTMEEYAPYGLAIIVGREFLKSISK